MAKDDKETVIDADEWREGLGINALEQENAELRREMSELRLSFDQLLAYMVAVDMRVQELAGEPVVKKGVKPHVTDKGLHVELVGEDGRVPNNLRNPNDFPGVLMESKNGDAAVTMVHHE